MSDAIRSLLSQFPVMWWYDDNNSTEVYPITDFGSSLRTSTDAEVRFTRTHPPCFAQKSQINSPSRASRS